MDNTVGSLNWQQKSVILGCVLGDGHLRKLEGRKNAFLEVNHSAKAKEYVEWKYKILKDICKSAPKERKIDKKRKALRFFTREHPEITEIYEKFYKDGKKIVPKGFRLNPLILAVWFMDDGSKTKKGDIYLNTQKFDWKSQRRLLHALRMIGIKARMNKDKKYWRIRIYKDSLLKLVKLISPYIVESMRYKLPV